MKRSRREEREAYEEYIHDLTMRTIWKPVCAALAIVVILWCLLTGCAFTCTSYETGVSAGRSFDDGGILASGSTIWNVNLRAHFDRDRK